MFPICVRAVALSLLTAVVYASSVSFLPGSLTSMILGQIRAFKSHAVPRTAEEELSDTELSQRIGEDLKDDGSPLGAGKRTACSQLAWTRVGRQPPQSGTHLGQPA